MPLNLMPSRTVRPIPEPDDSALGKARDGWAAGWKSALPIGFVIFSLIVLLVLPLPVDQRTQKLWKTVAQVAEPARRQLNSMKFALAVEVSSIRGFLLTADPTFLRRHDNAVQQEAFAYAELRNLTKELGPEIQKRADELNAAELHWRVPTAQLLRKEIGIDDYIKHTSSHQARYEEVLATAAILENAILSREQELLEEIRKLTRLDFILTLVLGLLALASTLLVAGLYRRLRSLLVQVRRYAEEEARLLRNEHAARTEAENAVQARDEVLGIVTHDLLNPLNTITISAELLDQPSISEDKRANHIAIIRRSVDGMNRLIQDLLNVAKLKTGLLSLERHPTEVSSLLNEASATLQPLAAARGIELRADPLETLPSIDVDRNRILEVYSNLVGNAIRFTPEGGSIRLHAERGVNGEVRFTVADTARPIAKDDIPMLFDPYHWRDVSEPHRGAGLGLAIAKGIVEAHGGHIGLETDPHVGNVFVFTIPVAHPSSSS